MSIRSRQKQLRPEKIIFIEFENVSIDGNRPKSHLFYRGEVFRLFNFLTFLKIIIVIFIMMANASLSRKNNNLNFQPLAKKIIVKPIFYRLFSTQLCFDSFYELFNNIFVIPIRKSHFYITLRIFISQQQTNYFTLQRKFYSNFSFIFNESMKHRKKTDRLKFVKLKVEEESKKASRSIPYHKRTETPRQENESSRTLSQADFVHEKQHRTATALGELLTSIFSLTLLFFHNFSLSLY